MNTTLREAEFCDPAGVRRKFDVFFVPKRLIRYVQIPTEIDIKASLEKLFSKYIQYFLLDRRMPKIYRSICLSYYILC